MSLEGRRHFWQASSAVESTPRKQTTTIEQLNYRHPLTQHTVVDFVAADLGFIIKTCSTHLPLEPHHLALTRRNGIDCPHGRL